MGVSPFHLCPDETRQLSTSSRSMRRAVPADSAGERLWKTPHTNHYSSCWRVLLTPEASGSHKDDTCHDGDTGSHGMLQDLAVICEDVSDGQQRSTLLADPEERPNDQPTCPPFNEDWRKATEILSICEANLGELSGRVQYKRARK